MILPPLSLGSYYIWVVMVSREGVMWSEDLRGQRMKREIADPTSRDRSNDRRSESSLTLRR